MRILGMDTMSYAYARLVSIALLDLAAGAHAQQISICPSAIAPTNLQMVNVPQGWNANILGPLYLFSAAPSDGPPNEHGELVNHKHEKIKSGWRDQYDLEGNFPRGKWLVCRYGDTGRITLSKRLDDEIKRCSVRYQQGAYVGEALISIRCE